MHALVSITIDTFTYYNMSIFQSTMQHRLVFNTSKAWLHILVCSS